MFDGIFIALQDVPTAAIAIFSVAMCIGWFVLAAINEAARGKTSST